MHSVRNLTAYDKAKEPLGTYMVSLTSAYREVEASLLNGRVKRYTHRQLQTLSLCFAQKFSTTIGLLPLKQA